MSVSAMRVAVVQVIKTGMLERLGKTPCNLGETLKKYHLLKKYFVLWEKVLPFTVIRSF